MYKYRMIYGVLLFITIFIFLLGILVTLFDDQLAKVFLTKSNEEDGIRVEWVGFWGNLLGSCLQGIATAAGIIVTVQMFTIDKKDRNDSEQVERERMEQEQFIKDFGKVLAAYDQLYKVLSNYGNISILHGQIDNISSWSLIINDGELAAKISILIREVYNNEGLAIQYKGFNTVDPEHFKCVDGEIKRKVEKLVVVVESKREEHIQRFSQLTNVNIILD